MKAKPDRDMTMALERSRLFTAKNTRPERTGPQSFSFEDAEEWGAYHYGVLIALDLTQSDYLDLQSDIFRDAMQDGDARTLALFARAAEDVRRAREDGLTSKAKHVVALLTSKLEFDDILGETPPKRLVIEFARRWFAVEYGMEAAAKQDTATWGEYIKAAGLRYLPTTVSKLHKAIIES